jgi:hypothetical protein
MIINCFKDRCEVDVDLWHIFKGLWVMIDLYFLSFWVSDDLSADIDSIGFIEDINAHMIGEVGISDLLHGSEAYFGDMFSLSPGNLP